MYSTSYDKKKICTQCGGNGVTRCDSCHGYTCPKCSQLVVPNKTAEAQIYHIKCVPKRFRKEVEE